MGNSGIETLSIRCDKRYFSNNIDIAIIAENFNGARYVAKPLELELVPDNLLISQPTATLSPKDAQILMDELWNCGVRPSEGTGSAGSLAATEKHLKDMRGIAIGLLRKDGIELG